MASTSSRESQEQQKTTRPGKASSDTGNTRRLLGITLAACLIFWVFVFNDSGWGPILAPLSGQLHVSLVTAGLFYVIWSIGYLPGALVGGAMLDRYGPRRVLFGAVIWVFCGILCIFVGLFLPQAVPVVVLLGVAGLAGMGGGVIDATTNGLISIVYAEKRGAALNLFNLLYPLGGVIIALIDAGLLAGFHNDPRPAFIFTLGFAIVAVLSLYGVPPRYTVQEQKKEAFEQPTGIKSTLTVTDCCPGSRNRGYDADCRHQFECTRLGTRLPACRLRANARYRCRVEQRHLGASSSPVAWELRALILRIGSWRMIMLGVLIALCGLIAMLFSPNAVLATVAIAIVSIGLSPIFATCLTIASERAGHSLGSVAGILLCAGGISTVFCGWCFGLLLNTASATWAVLFCLLFTLLGGFMALRLRTARAVGR